MPTRPPKAVANEEMAAALACARLHGDKVASEQFNISVRSLQRKRKAIAEGKAPELAALVAETTQATTNATRGLLQKVYEKSLRTLENRLEQDEATGSDGKLRIRDIVGAVHILGNQLMARDFLDEDEDKGDGSTGHDQPAAPHEADEGTAAGREGGGKVVAFQRPS